MNRFIFYSLIATLVMVSIFSLVGLVEIFPEIDRLFSHRLHYMNLMLIPSFFGSTGVHTIDSSMVDLLNKGGIFAFAIYIYVMYKVRQINYYTEILVIGFLLLGLLENILNQYNILAPLIFLFYFKEKNKNHFVKDLN